MAVIKRPRAEAIQVAPLDLSDVRDEADAIIAAAKAEAAQIVRDAVAERARLLEGASEQGHREGFQKGEQEGASHGRESGEAAALVEMKERVELLAQSVGEALGALDRQREQMLESLRRDLAELAGIFASKVAKRSVELDPGAGESQLRHVLSIIGKSNAVQIRVSPDDERMLRDRLPEVVAAFSGIQHAELEADESLSRGSCVVSCGEGAVFDASIEAQIDRLAALVCPAKVHRDEQPGGAAERAA